MIDYATPLTAAKFSTPALTVQHPTQGATYCSKVEATQVGCWGGGGESMHIRKMWVKTQSIMDHIYTK